MNKQTLIIIIFLISTLINGSAATMQDTSNWQWSKIEVISVESTGSSVLSNIVVDSEDNLHIVWADNTDYNSAGTDFDIFYKKYIAASDIWSSAVIISTQTIGDSETPSIAIDSNNNIHIVWQDATDYNGAGADVDIFYKKFNSTTLLWSNTEVVSTESTAKSDTATLAIDSANNIHVTWKDQTDYNGGGTDNDIFYKKYSIDSQLWSTTEVLSTESIGHSWAPSVKIDSEDNVHVIWHDYTDYNSAGTDGDLFYKKWDHRSAEWSAVDVVTPKSTAHSRAPAMAIDSEDNIHIAWRDSTNYSNAGTDNDIFYKLYTKASQSWSDIEVVSTESISSSNSVSIAIDGGDNIHLAWTDSSDFQGAGTDSDIFYKNKISNQISWGSTHILTQNSGSSQLAKLAIDRSQQIHVIWEDVTNYLGSGVDSDIFYEKFSGKPNAPVLEDIVPNPSDGVINLIWNDDFYATSYSVYRDISPIYDIGNLIKIAETSNSYYVEELSIGGTYYYAIIANNIVGSSELSNSVYVRINTIQETITEIHPDIITDTVTEVNNVEITKTTSVIETTSIIETTTKKESANFPISVPVIFSAITISLLIKRRRD